MDDRKLLREYVEQGSEAAFAELVNRHTDLVYSAALRQTNGDPHLAEEIAQVVFLTLARKARLLSTRVILAGWLIDATRREAAGMRRRWLRREQREKFAAEMNPQPDPNPLDAAWSRIAPLLDESLARLRETERDAMVLHYLRRMTFKEVGEALDLSEEAARKRVSRALEELRRFFVSRGVVFPAATIGLLLSSFAVQAAPVSLAPATAKLALMAASAQAGGFAASILELLIMTAKAKTAVIAVAGIVALITMVLQKQQNARLRAELAVVREENNRLSSAKQSRGLDRAAAQDLSASRSEARGKGTTADRKPSLDEIEAKVREAGSKAVWMPSSEWRRFVSTIDVSDFPQVLAVVEKLPIKLTRDKIRDSLLLRWAEENPAAAVAYAQSAPDRLQAVSPVLRVWAELEPEAAAAWVKQLPDAGFRNTAITATCIEIALRNPALAFDLVQNYYSGPRADRGLPNLIFTAWAETDPTTAIAKASELSQPLERQNALYSIAATWASKDPQSALAWAESLPNEERNVAIGNVIFKWTENDPHAVRAWFQQLPDGLIKQMAADNLPRSLATADPLAAAQFVAELPPGSAQTRAAEEVARAWANSDPGSAAEWAKAFPNGEPRDVVLRDIIFRWSKSDPRAASQWLQNLSADSFSNENILNASIQSVARGLLELDRKAGEDWLEKTSLPDEIKRQLLRKP